MSRTPAARVARLKVEFPAWTIQAGHGSDGYSVTAFRKGEHGGFETLIAASPARLELMLYETIGPETVAASPRVRRGRR